MKVIKKFIIELAYEEAIALKIILGKLSPNAKKELGLDSVQSEAMSELFSELPNREDD